MGGCQRFVYVFVRVSSFWGRKAHKKSPPPKSQENPGKFSLMCFLFMCFVFAPNVSFFKQNFHWWSSWSPPSRTGCRCLQPVQTPVILLQNLSGLCVHTRSNFFYCRPCLSCMLCCSQCLCHLAAASCGLRADTQHICLFFQCLGVGGHCARTRHR